MRSLSCLCVLAASGVLRDVQAAPRGSPAGAGLRRLGHKEDTAAPTPHPTHKKQLIPTVEYLNKRVDAETEGEVDWDTSPSPTTSSFQAEWGSQPQPTPTAFDKNTPWIDIDGNDEDDADVDDTDPTPPPVFFAPPTPVYVAPPTLPPVYVAPPTPPPVYVALPTFPPVYVAPPTFPPVYVAPPTFPPVYVAPPTFPPAYVAPPPTPFVYATPSPAFGPVAATLPWPTIPVANPGPTAVVNFQTMSPTVDPSPMPSSAPAIATFAPVALTPVNFGFIEKLPTLTFTTQPSGIPSMLPSSGFPSAAPTVGSLMPTEDNTLWTPLKTFDIQLQRDKRWNTQFAPEELKSGLETYLVDSFMILSAELKNVTLNLFTSAYNEDKSEAWFRFQGRLFYDPKGDGEEISPDEVWSQQMKLLGNMDAIQWILENQPAMAAGFVTVKTLSFLDGSSTQTFDGYSGASSSGLNQTTKIIIAVAAILLILACSVGVYIFLFLDGESEEPLPVIESKLTGNTGSDLSVGKELNSDHKVPEVTFEEEDFQSEMSSITEIKTDPQVPGPSSVDAIASNDSRLASVSDMESLQPSTIEPDWSITASNVDTMDPPTTNNLLPPEDDHPEHDGSVEDLYVK